MSHGRHPGCASYLHRALCLGPQPVKSEASGVIFKMRASALSLPPHFLERFRWLLLNCSAVASAVRQLAGLPSLQLWLVNCSAAAAAAAVPPPLLTSAVSAASFSVTSPAHTTESKKRKWREAFSRACCSHTGAKLRKVFPQPH
ncbi:RIKEN cDNA 4930543L23 [Mus musculus]|nr:RIKEN cDNA 4930543L23 [Mus musculus]